MISTLEVVTAFGEAKTIKNWFTDPRSGVANTMAYRARLQAGMTPLEAIETPRKIARKDHIEPNTELGLLVTTDQFRVGNQGREVMCRCECGTLVWRVVKHLKRVNRSSCSVSCPKRHLILTFDTPERVERRRQRQRELTQQRTDEQRQQRAEYMRQWKAANPESQARADILSRVTAAPGERLAINELYKLAKSGLPVVCSYCGKITLCKPDRQVDHKTPKAKGGGHFVSNLIIACTQCNQSKGVRTEHEYLLMGVVIDEPLRLDPPFPTIPPFRVLPGGFLPPGPSGTVPDYIQSVPAGQFSP